MKSSWRSVPRAERLGIVLAACVTVLALVVAVLACLVAQRNVTGPGDAERATLLTATRDAVEAVLTSSPAGAARDLLATPLAQEYDAYGIAVALPGVGLSAPQAVQFAEVQTTVIGTGIVDYTPELSRVLVFADQSIVVGEQEPQRNPLTRRAIMRNVDGRWLLADLEEVGDLTG